MKLVRCNRKSETIQRRAMAAKRAVRNLGGYAEFHRVLQSESGLQLDRALVQIWCAGGVGPTWVPWVGRSSGESLTSLLPEAHPSWLQIKLR
ncbi:MAG: hypothetical protein GY813_10075 [Halieaceae bacterium]|nr:hypothetical protein [Halieaceae bacterium]